MHHELLGSAALLQNNTIRTSQLAPGLYELEVQCSPASFCSAQPSRLSFTRLPARMHAPSTAAGDQPEDQALPAGAAEKHASAAEADQEIGDPYSLMEVGDPAMMIGAGDFLSRADRADAGLSRVHVLEAVVRVVHDNSAVSRAGGVQLNESSGWGKDWVQGAVILCLLACQASIAVLS